MHVHAHLCGRLSPLLPLPLSTLSCFAPVSVSLCRRGPFSGGKVMHAHLCGRLPRNTLVVAYDPELPACMISGDVAQGFRWGLGL